MNVKKIVKFKIPCAEVLLYLDLKHLTIPFRERRMQIYYKTDAVAQENRHQGSNTAPPVHTFSAKEHHVAYTRGE